MPEKHIYTEVHTDIKQNVEMSYKDTGPNGYETEGYHTEVLRCTWI